MPGGYEKREGMIERNHSRYTPFISSSCHPLVLLLRTGYWVQRSIGLPIGLTQYGTSYVHLDPVHTQVLFTEQVNSLVFWHAITKPWVLLSWKACISLRIPWDSFHPPLVCSLLSCPHILKRSQSPPLATRPSLEWTMFDLDHGNAEGDGGQRSIWIHWTCLEAGHSFPPHFHLFRPMESHCLQVLLSYISVREKYLSLALNVFLKS